jgi:ketosteroid isomerase-like protein
MSSPARSELSESQIRNWIDRRAAAVRARDVGAAAAMLAGPLVQFDVVGELSSLGAQAAEQRLKQWLESFTGPIDFDPAEISITAAGDVGFAHCLNHVRAEKIGGGEIDMWWRSTMCFQRIDGRWKIVHEHDSVPFDPATGKARLDLKP